MHLWIEDRRTLNGLKSVHTSRSFTVTVMACLLAYKTWRKLSSISIKTCSEGTFSSHVDHKQAPANAFPVPRKQYISITP